MARTEVITPAPMDRDDQEREKDRREVQKHSIRPHRDPVPRGPTEQRGRDPRIRLPTVAAICPTKGRPTVKDFPDADLYRLRRFAAERSVAHSG